MTRQNFAQSLLSPAPNFDN